MHGHSVKKMLENGEHLLNDRYKSRPGVGYDKNFFAMNLKWSICPFDILQNELRKRQRWIPYTHASPVTIKRKFYQFSQGHVILMW